MCTSIGKFLWHGNPRMEMFRRDGVHLSSLGTACLTAVPDPCCCPSASTSIGCQLSLILQRPFSGPPHPPKRERWLLVASQFKQRNGPLVSTKSPPRKYILTMLVLQNAEVTLVCKNNTSIMSIMFWRVVVGLYKIEVKFKTIKIGLGLFQHRSSLEECHLSNGKL